MGDSRGSDGIHDAPRVRRTAVSACRRRPGKLRWVFRPLRSPRDARISTRRSVSSSGTTAMKRTRRLLLTAVLGLALVATAGPRLGQQIVEIGEPPRFENFERVIKGSKEFDGLFKLHQKDDRLYAEIRPDQFEKPFLLPIAIARGAGMGGSMLNFDEQWVLLVRPGGA